MQDDETSIAQGDVANHSPMNHPNYLAAHRKNWALNKEELGLLIGFRSSTPIYRSEIALADPSLKLVIGCEVVFGVQVRQLFPAVYARAEEAIMERAAALDARLRGWEGPVASRKRELLAQMVERAQNLPIV
jgi:hypothetical protein